MNAYFTKIKTCILLIGLLFLAFSPISAEDNQSAKTEKSSFEGELRFVKVQDDLILLPLPHESQRLMWHAVGDAYDASPSEFDRRVIQSAKELGFTDSLIGEQVFFHNYSYIPAFFKSKIDSIGIFKLNETDGIYFSTTARFPSRILSEVKRITKEPSVYTMLIQWTPSTSQHRLNKKEVTVLKRTDKPQIDNGIRDNIIKCLQTELSTHRFDEDSLIITGSLPGDEKGVIDYFSVRYQTIFDSVKTIRNYIVRHSSREFKSVYSNGLTERIPVEYTEDTPLPEIILSLHGAIDVDFDEQYEIVIEESGEDSWTTTLLQFENGVMVKLAQHVEYGVGC